MRLADVARRQIRLNVKKHHEAQAPGFGACHVDWLKELAR